MSTLYVTKSTAGSVPGAANVLFENIIYSFGTAITYSTITGEFTILEPGQYSFDWWVSTQTTLSPGTAFTLLSSQGDALVGTSPLKNGQVSGIGVIEVLSPPVTVSLRNAGTAPIFYSQLAETAAMRVTQGAAQGPAGPTGPTGPAGPTGPTGDTGPAGTLQDSSYCLSIAQLANLLEQVIVLYPGVTMTIFAEQLATFSGIAQEVYTAPAASGPGLLVLDGAGQYLYVNLSKIVAFYLGNVVYNPAITYLTPPSPLPAGCDTDLILGIQAICPVGQEVAIATALTTSASGTVTISEFGILVLTTAPATAPYSCPRRLSGMWCAIRLPPAGAPGTQRYGSKTSFRNTGFARASKGRRRSLRRLLLS